MRLYIMEETLDTQWSSRGVRAVPVVKNTGRFIEIPIKEIFEEVERLYKEKHSLEDYDLVSRPEIGHYAEYRHNITTTPQSHKEEQKEEGVE